ncbi:MAG: hypothetical protein AAF628_02630 [Planctomycetota bacterium]
MKELEAAMLEGSRELTKATAAYLASVAFAITFLVSTLCGAAGLTALTRGSIAAGAALLIGPVLARPAVSVILDAMARDRARGDAEAE